MEEVQKSWDNKVRRLTIYGGTDQLHLTIDTLLQQIYEKANLLYNVGLALERDADLTRCQALHVRLLESNMNFIHNALSTLVAEISTFKGRRKTQITLRTMLQIFHEIMFARQNSMLQSLHEQAPMMILLEARPRGRGVQRMLEAGNFYPLDNFYRFLKGDVILFASEFLPAMYVTVTQEFQTRCNDILNREDKRQLETLSFA